MSNKPTALVTSGPTLERIDPVRFISNFSSGKQGYAIAAALQSEGFEVTLISGPVNISAPSGVKLVKVESAEEMLSASVSVLPVDVAVCAAAVCDFKPAEALQQKFKKQNAATEITIRFIQNPDILKTISNHKYRPKIVVGFAAETENLLENAKQKLLSKGCDIVIANDVSDGKVFGHDNNNISVVMHHAVEEVGNVSKEEVAFQIVNKISKLLKNRI